jgi:hypothetical protein
MLGFCLIGFAVKRCEASSFRLDGARRREKFILTFYIFARSRFARSLLMQSDWKN